ncbi:MAG: circadian clock protein KaiB [Chitinivibrionales bacterium]|nr:circadian clock protein KaiB [Chitinivibrionales bacterium]MBD3356175.1 circadian clock protein KaiB [Chitinivibrionales bacterium]
MSKDARQKSSTKCGKYRLRLFTAGNEYNSMQARKNLKKFCQEHFGCDCELEEIDVLENPSAALQEQILVTPTLEVRTNGPESRILIFGNLTDRRRLEAAMPDKG